MNQKKSKHLRKLAGYHPQKNRGDLQVVNVENGRIYQYKGLAPRGIYNQIKRLYKKGELK